MDIVDRIADCLVADHVELMQENESLRQQLAQTLAACEKKDGALNDEYAYQNTHYHEPNHNLSKALAIQPDASALRQHDDVLIERVIELVNKLLYCDNSPISDAIRELKGKP